MAEIDAILYDVTNKSSTASWKINRALESNPLSVRKVCSEYNVVNVACERQTSLLAHRRWGTFHEETSQTQRAQLPPPPPLKKSVVIITVYKKLYRKNHPDATRSVHTLEHFSKLCLKMYRIASQRIFISKNFQGSMFPDPPRKLAALGHSGLLPQPINRKYRQYNNGSWRRNV